MSDYRDPTDPFSRKASDEAPQDKDNRLVFLVLGPWRHSGINGDATTLGPLRFDGDTALQVRRDVIEPFLAEHLKDGAPKADTAPALVFETGTNAWRRLPAWPLSCESGCASRSAPLYLQPHFGLSFTGLIEWLRICADPTELRGIATAA